MGVKAAPIELRFWEKVDVVPSGCWEWRGTVTPSGYGIFKLPNPNRRDVRAHRQSYEFLVGPIPEGLTIDHLCRNKLCVRPDHLEAVTHRVNILRGTAPSAHNAVKTHCKYGHPFDEANTRILPKGRRACRTCAVRTTLEYEARNRKKVSENHRLYMARRKARLAS